MQKQTLFNIGFVSAALSVFYAAALIGRPPRIRALPLLIRSFIRTPRLLPLQQVQPYRDHSYVAEVDVDTPDIETGLSPFILLEDDVPLAHPHVRSLTDIASLGMGRYTQIKRQIVFSPSDNADLRQVHRRYELVESLVPDRARMQMLSRLNQQREQMPNAGLWLLTKLRVHFPKRLQIAGVVPDGPQALILERVMLDLSDYGLGPLRMARMVLRWTASTDTAWQSLEVTIDGLTADWLAQPAQLQLGLGFTADAELRLEVLRLHHGAAPWLAAELIWDADGLQAAGISLAGLPGLRDGLVQACGGAAAMTTWLTRLLADIGDGHLPLHCRLDPAAQAAILAALLPEATAQLLRLSLRREAGQLVLAARAEPAP